MRTTPTVTAAVVASLCLLTGCTGGGSPAPASPSASSSASTSRQPAPTGSTATPTPVAAKYKAAVSHPVKDSYYPQHGVPYLDTLHYGLQLDWQPKSKQLTGIATITLRVTTARDTIRFDLGAPLQVSAATVDGAKAASNQSGNHLTLKTAGLQPNSQHTVVIHYSGTPAPVPAPSMRGDLQRLGFQTTSKGAAYTFQEPFGAFTWYPVNDQPADKAFYDATLTAHDGQQGVFNGQVVSSKTKGTNTTTRFHLARPAASYLTTMAFGDYKHETAKGPHGLPLNYWYQPSAATPMPIVRQTPKMIAWAEKQLGRYPFASAGVVLVSGHSGMETQSLVTMTDNVLAFRSGGIYQSEYAHELFHSWFGDAVTPTDWKDLWLSESLTFFMQYRYIAHIHQPQSWGTYADIQKYQDQLMRDSDGPPGAYDKKNFGGNTVYLSGALMLHNLEKAYGAKRFNAALKGWPAAHKYGNADRADFISYLDKALGPKAGPYVKHWLTAKKTPAPLAKQP
ncbi:M1 family metallopeptidase [Flexivirga sp. B27]